MAHEIKSPKDFHNMVQLYEDANNSVIYRGVTDATYQLFTSVGRHLSHVPRRRQRAEEKDLFTQFKVLATQYLANRPADDWEWMATAQHYRLPTRLLDWSMNPLVAAYFAISESKNTDGAIYAFKNEYMVLSVDYKSPFTVPSVVEFHPHHITQRITAQAGVFTVHPDPFKPFHSRSIDKWIIKNSFKKDFLNMLKSYGVNASTVFPDLEGVSAYLKWLWSDA
jgi:hypothetical protein